MEKTVLKIGELAARSGLTVRALHHYDDIGLLKPSARADSGYRLYNRDDVERLHRVQALRKFGMSLADIATFLASPDAPFADVVSQQIAALDQQIKQASTLREQLRRLQQQMTGGGTPALENWLGALEHMSLYEQYFTLEELKRLPFWQQEARRNAVWRGMVDQVKTLIAQGLPSSSAEASALAQRWMETLEHDTAANPEFAQRMTMMMQDERFSPSQAPIPQDVQEYISEAFNERKMSLYAKYLNAEEMQHIRVNSRKYFHEWLALLVKVHAQMESGAAADHPETLALAREWMRLFRARAGSHPDTQSRVRLANESEPELLKGTWVSPATLAYIRQAVAACEQA